MKKFEQNQKQQREEKEKNQGPDAAENLEHRKWTTYCEPWAPPHPTPVS